MQTWHFSGVHWTGLQDFNAGDAPQRRGCSSTGPPSSPSWRFWLPAWEANIHFAWVSIWKVPPSFSFQFLTKCFFKRGLWLNCVMELLQNGNCLEWNWICFEQPQKPLLIYPWFWSGYFLTVIWSRKKIFFLGGGCWTFKLCKESSPLKKDAGIGRLAGATFSVFTLNKQSQVCCFQRQILWNVEGKLICLRYCWLGSVIGRWWCTLFSIQKGWAWTNK